MSERALHVHFPSLVRAVPMATLGAFPTPVMPLPGLRERLGAGTPELWVKRDDQSAVAYGGNKVRTLEVLFAEALAQGATRIVSTGAFGSNHAAATVLHARRVGLEPGALLFPQPQSAAARENLAVTVTHGARVEELPHWSFLPYGLARAHLLDKQRRERSYVMVPGGATPLGALGYVSAAFELAGQVARGELPAPRAVVLAVGSTCTTAGLLLGFTLAARLGLGFRVPPRVVSVRVTPWPVTRHARIVQLAFRAAELMERYGAL
ncbi:MAG: pyridoxal-phosphate dependent enzyme, partial [Myxococcales bacterium]|nr:pyridoxal-phosphate dependent enzyme [Myxococcales bacterium]